jgi:hypothetical protein
MRVIGSALLALVCLGYFACKSAHAQQRIALVIANQGYNAKVGPLKNPHNDVVLVGAALRSVGYHQRGRRRSVELLDQPQHTRGKSARPGATGYALRCVRRVQE